MNKCLVLILAFSACTPAAPVVEDKNESALWNTVAWYCPCDQGAATLTLPHCAKVTSFDAATTLDVVAVARGAQYIIDDPSAGQRTMKEEDLLQRVGERPTITGEGDMKFCRTP